MIKKVLVFLTILLFISSTAYAVNGELSLKYNTMQENYIGTIKLYKFFGDLKIGGTLITNMSSFSKKDGYFPAGVPISQHYGLNLEYKFNENVSLTLDEWCIHHFAQSDKGSFFDEEDITIGIKYKF